MFCLLLSPPPPDSWTWWPINSHALWSYEETHFYIRVSCSRIQIVLKVFVREKSHIHSHLFGSILSTKLILIIFFKAWFFYSKTKYASSYFLELIETCIFWTKWSWMCICQKDFFPSCLFLTNTLWLGHFFWKKARRRSIFNK